MKKMIKADDIKVIQFSFNRLEIKTKQSIGHALLIAIPQICLVEVHPDTKTLLMELSNGSTIEIVEGGNYLIGKVEECISQYERDHLPKEVILDCKADKFRCNY